jgi:hypothetical protein
METLVYSNAQHVHVNMKFYLLLCVTNMYWGSTNQMGVVI